MMRSRRLLLLQADQLIERDLYDPARTHQGWKKPRFFKKIF